MTRKSLFAIHAFGGMTANERRLGRFLRDGAGHPDPAPAPQEPKADEPAAPTDAAFDAAFAALTAGETPAPVENPADGGAGGAGVDGGADVGGEPAAAPAGDAGGDVGGEPAAAPVATVGDAPAAPSSDPAPAAPVAAGTPSPDDVLQRLAGLINQPAPATVETPAEPEPQAPIYSAEEQAAIAEYEQNWPDVSKAEMLKRRAEYHDIFKYVFSQVAEYVKPLQKQVATIGNTLHLTELKQAVPDYTEAVEADVHKWIETQPGYLQTGMKQVMQGGTSEEVADLIGRYKAATGATPAVPAPAAPAAAPAAQAPKAAVKTELSSAAKQAAELLAPVSSDRSTIPQGEDLQDFDSAFAKYAATGGAL